MRKTKYPLGWWLFMIMVVFALFGLTSYTGPKNNSECANSISCINDLSGKLLDQSIGIYMGKKIPIPVSLLAKDNPLANVLGNNTLNKHIEVDLTNQRLMAYEGDQIAFYFSISSGKWYPTPTGKFRIWIKLRATRMSGGNPAYGTYYNLPNVPWTMFYYNDEIPKERGFSLHGAYWHNNFGHPMSHGCVNIHPGNAKKLYDWANPVSTAHSTYASFEDPGTEVNVFGTAPIE